AGTAPSPRTWRICTSSRRWAVSPDLLKAVEDQIEPEPELAVRTIGFLVVLSHVLGDVGKSIDGELPSERRPHIRELPRSCRVTDLPHREPEDVAIQGVIRVMGHVGCEASFAKSSEQ